MSNSRHLSSLASLLARLCLARRAAHRSAAVKPSIVFGFLEFETDPPALSAPRLPAFPLVSSTHAPFYSFDDLLRSSSFAIVRRCTWSGPSASLNVLTLAYNACRTSTARVSVKSRVRARAERTSTEISTHRQRHFVRDAHPTVHLDRPIDDGQHRPRRVHLGHRDLRPRSLGSDPIDAIRRVQHLASDNE